MALENIIRLIVLAAIWGGSFIFMRIVAPVLGPIVTTDIRVILGGVVLALYCKFSKFDLQWKSNWKHYFIIGIINCALPFALYAFAALHIPASLSVVLNSTAPMFGAIFSSFWLQEKLTTKKLVGLTLGTIGVGIISFKGGFETDDFFIQSIAACLVATICYGLTGVYMKKYASHVKPLGIACGSQLMAGLILFPGLFLFPVTQEISVLVILSLVALAVLCSAIAFLLYYRLVANEGPTKALTVTFLMPVFGILWGVLFLSEAVSLNMLLGAATIVTGTVLVTRK